MKEHKYLFLIIFLIQVHEAGLFKALSSICGQCKNQYSCSNSNYQKPKKLTLPMGSTYDSQMTRADTQYDKYSEQYQKPTIDKIQKSNLESIFQIDEEDIAKQQGNLIQQQLEQERKEKLNQKIELFKFKHRMNDDCLVQVDFTKNFELADNKDEIDQIFNQDDFTYKVYTFEDENDDQVYIAENEYENLRQLSEQNDKKNRNKQHQTNFDNLFLENIQCILDADYNKTYYIIKQQKIGDHLDFEQNCSFQSIDYFRLFKVKYPDNFRYNIYKQLFKQLLIFKNLQKVHRNIKPMNIVTNHNFTQLQCTLRNTQLSISQRNQQLDYLKMYIANLNSMGSINDDTFVGDKIYMHPQYYNDIQHIQKYEYDIYQLSLSLIAVELTQLGFNSSYIFSHYNNINCSQRHNKIQNQNAKITSIKQCNKQMLDFIRQQAMTKLCDYKGNKSFRNRQTTDKRKENFFQECGDCLACVIAQAIQYDTEKIPSSEQIIQAIENITKGKSIKVVQNLQKTKSIKII